MPEVVCGGPGRTGTVMDRLAASSVVGRNVFQHISVLRRIWHHVLLFVGGVLKFFRFLDHMYTVCTDVAYYLEYLLRCDVHVTYEQRRNVVFVL